MVYFRETGSGGRGPTFSRGPILLIYMLIYRTCNFPGGVQIKKIT